MKKIKEKSGITLIALVITIIVLLILASVSIAMLTGNNGILTQAKNAKEATEKAAEKENNDLLEIEMRANNSIANIPNLKEGMIPVKWNASSKTWEVADKNNTGNDWYDYSASSKKWANVVTVKENCSNGKTRTDYLSAGVGTPIPEDDITTMFVWIPRYSYYVKSGYHENANGTGEFAIKFLIGTSDRIVDAPEGQEKAIRTSDTNGETNGGKYVVHPAFTADTDLGGTGEEITGFWVGKFESSNVESPRNNEGITASSDGKLLYGYGNQKDITIRPNVTSWRNKPVTDLFKVSQNMAKDENKLYGFNSSELTTTMMQNSQWGAVAYLAQSEYGNMQKSTDGESGIWNNPYNEGFTKSSTNSYKMENYSTNMTGMAGTRSDNSIKRDTNTNYYSKVVDGSKKDNGDSIEITYTNINSNATTGSNYTNTYYRYYTENGQKASTTRTIYGVYDMSGCGNEYVMGNYNSTIGSSGFTTLPNSKYYDKYTITSDTSCTIATCGGHALFETANWYSDNKYFVTSSYTWFMRGGYYGDGAKAGTYHSSYNNGSKYATYAFRVVIADIGT